MSKDRKGSNRDQLPRGKPATPAAANEAIPSYPRAVTYWDGYYAWSMNLNTDLTLYGGGGISR